jgi:hypothetical protein
MGGEEARWILVLIFFFVTVRTIIIKTTAHLTRPGPVFKSRRTGDRCPNMSLLQQDRLRSKINAYVQRFEEIRNALNSHQLLHPQEACPNSVEELSTLDTLRDLFVHWGVGMGQSISDKSWVKVWNEIESIDKMRLEVNDGGGGVLAAPVPLLWRKRKSGIESTPIVEDYTALDPDQQHDLAVFEQSSGEESSPTVRGGEFPSHLDPASLVSFVDAVLNGI